MERLIYKLTMDEPYMQTPQSWLAKIFLRIRDILATFLRLEPVADHALYVALQTHAGLSKNEAKAKVYKIDL